MRAHVRPHERAHADDPQPGGTRGHGRALGDVDEPVPEIVSDSPPTSNTFHINDLQNRVI